MKILKVVFIIFFALRLTAVHAQNLTASKEIRILNNYSSIPFEDGKTIVTEINFTGFDGDYEQYDKTVGSIIPESDFRKMLRENRAEIKADDKFSGGKVSKVVKLLREWLAENGYDEAKVGAFGEKLPKNQMTLTFKIDRGALARVLEIRFVGNINLTNEELVENFKQCSHDDWEIFDARKYQYFSQKCSRQIMFSKGYFEAKINRITPKTVDDNRIVTIEVSEGVRYRYGNIKVAGEKTFTENEILEIGKLKTGDVADGKTLQEFIYSTLKRLYADKGYVLYNAEFDPTLIKPQAEGLDATVDLSITIDEGVLFKLANINFIGVEKDKAEELRKLFPLKDGETYNQDKFENGIKKINETKEFYNLDSDDRHIELRTNEDLGYVQLVISLEKVD